MESKIRIALLNSSTLPVQILAALVLYCGLSGPLWAPPSPGWCKNNTFLTPIAGADLSFGTFASSAGGNVYIAVGGTRTADPGITLLGGAPRQAAYAISGCPDYAYSIVTPPDSTLVFGANSMTVTNFQSFPAGSGILDANGAGSLQFGATLVVGFPQAAGAYTGTYLIEIIIQ